jgi:hypothetical protein
MLIQILLLLVNSIVQILLTSNNSINKYQHIFLADSWSNCI